MSIQQEFDFRQGSGFQYGDPGFFSRQPRKKRTLKIVETPGVNTICPHEGGEVLVIHEGWNYFSFVDVRMGTNVKIQHAEKRRFHEAVKAAQSGLRSRNLAAEIRKAKIEDLVTVDVALREVGLSDAQSDQVVDYLSNHPEIDWHWRRDSESVSGGRLHLATFRQWSTVHNLLRRTPFLRIAGLDLYASDHLFGWLDQQTAYARLMNPSVDVALRIDSGETMCLADCDKRHIDLPKNWSGRVTVGQVKTAGGDILFEVQAGLKNMSDSLWLIDYSSASEAADVAALINASTNRIMPELLHRPDAVPDLCDEQPA